MAVTGDAGAATTYAYSFTAPTRVDAAGTTTMATDPFGRVTSLTPPGFGAFTWAYGADGAPMTAAAPNGNTTTYGYDTLGRLLTMTTGARASYTYTLNRAGSRLSEASTISGDPGNGTATLTDRPGGAGFLEWDSLGRLVRVRASQGGAVVVTYTYDALDRLRTVERAGSRIRFRDAGRTSTITQLLDGTALEELLRSLHRRGPAGRRRRRSPPASASAQRHRQGSAFRPYAISYTSLLAIGEEPT